MTLFKLVQTASLGLLTAALIGFSQSCAQPEQSATTPAESSEETSEPAAEAESGEGTLQVSANGEDFVRQGFTSRDGWAIQFDNVYLKFGGGQSLPNRSSV